MKNFLYESSLPANLQTRRKRRPGAPDKVPAMQHLYSELVARAADAAAKDAEEAEHAIGEAERERNERIRAEADLEKLAAQVKELTGGMGFDVHRRVQKARQEERNAELEGECDICFHDGGHHEEGCPKMEAKPDQSAGKKKKKKKR